MPNDSQITPKDDGCAEDWEVRAAARTKREAELFASNKKVLFDALTAAGISCVVATFDGYGDSGQTEGFETHAGDAVVHLPSSVIELFVSDSDQGEPRGFPFTIASAAERLVYDALEHTHNGWEDGEGAYGEVVFDVVARSITLNFNERYTASENYTHEL